MFNITQEHDYVPPDISVAMSSLLTFVPVEMQASLWWGESLMSTYWCIIASKLEAYGWERTSVGLYYITKGILYYIPQQQHPISSLDFFHFDYRILGNTPFEGEWIYPGYPDNYSHDTNHLAKIQAYPDVWEATDKLAKAAYSTIMIDLGQMSEESNILTDPKLLQEYTEVFGVFQDKYPYNTYGYANPGPATESYNTLEAVTGPLGTTSCTISTEYVCSVPKRKSTGNLIVSILVADAVFIQVTWRLFTFVVGLVFLRNDPTAQYCEGCIKEMRDEPESHDHSSSVQLLNADKGHVYSRVKPSITESASNLSDRHCSEERDGSSETLRGQDEQ